MSVDNVQDIEPLDQYTATGGQTVFPYTFPIFDDGDLVVYDNDTLQVLSTHYTVSGAGNDNGGNVTFLTGRTAGHTITIYRDVPIERTTDFQQNGPRRSADMNDELDRITMWMQQLETRIGRAVRMSLRNAQPSNELELDPIANWKERYFFVNSAGELEPAAAISLTTLSQSIIGQFLNPQTVAEAAAGVTPTDYAYPAGDARRYGFVGDGSTVNDAVFASALLIGIPIYIPSGTYLFNSPKTLLLGQVIYGDGMGKTVLNFKNTGATLNGFGISVSNVVFRDLTIQVDVSGQSACQAVQLSGTVDNITFERVKIQGTTTVTNNNGIHVSNCTLTGLFIHQCRFDTLALPLYKSNGDASVQKGTVITDCRVTNCIDGFEINSPAGAWTDVTIANCYFTNIQQFAIGLANIQRFSVTGCHFSNGALLGQASVDMEAIHIESASSDGSIVGCSFLNMNQTGTVGAINIIGAGVLSTGSHEIVIQGCVFDLRQASPLTPFGITVQAGGVGNPFNVTIVGNTFKCQANSVSYAISVSVCSGITISDNLFTNPNTASKIDAFVDISDSYVTGSNNTFYNPAGCIHVSNNSFGSVDASKIDGDLTSFDFLTGNTNGSTGICFGGFQIHRAFTADATPNWQNLFPAGTLFDGLIGVRFVQNGTTATWVEKLKAMWDGTTLTVTNVASNQGSGSATPPASGDWRVDSGTVQARSSNGSTIVGQVNLSFSGVYFP